MQLKPVDFIPIALAILCYVLAGVFKASPTVMVGLIGLGGTLTGIALPQLSAALDAVKAARANASGVVKLSGGREAGCTTAPAPLFFLAILFTLCACVFFFFARCAKADTVPPDTAGPVQLAWTVGSPATAYSFRDGSLQVGAQFGTCFSVTYTRLHIGGDICADVRAATKDLPNAGGAALGFHYRNAGFGIELLKEQGRDGLDVLMFVMPQLPLIGAL